MSKSLALVFTIFALLSPLAITIPVQVSTYCIGNCFTCPSNPFQCQYIQSLKYPTQNHNCIPYSFGQKCEYSSQGFQALRQNFDGMGNWLLNGTATQSVQCQLFHQITNNSMFRSLGPFKGGSSIVKQMAVDRDIIDSILIKAAFTMNQQNIFRNQTVTQNPNPSAPTPTDLQGPPEIGTDGNVNPQTESGQIGVNSQNRLTNRTNRSFVDVRITIDGTPINYQLQLNYPTRPADMSRVLNSTCGVHLQYVNVQIFPDQVRGVRNKNVRVEIKSLGDPNSNASWGLTKFEIFTGCSGLLLTSGGVNQKCRLCLNGFYPVRNYDGTIIQCGLCPSACKSCQSLQKCTLCQPNAIVNSVGVCEYIQNYINITQNRILMGQQSSKTVDSRYFYNLLQVQSEGADNVIRIQSRLQSPNKYSIKFYLIYNNEFIQTLNGGVVRIFTNQNPNVPRLIIQANQFRPQIGFYDQRLLANQSRFYVKKIKIQQNQININNTLSTIVMSVVAPPSSRNLFLANYQLLQFQCTARCMKCDRKTNLCLQCEGFFINRGTLGCSYCANGFYLKKSYNNTVSNYSLIKTTDDICVKCHSTCKQCTGPQLNQCTQCFKLFYLTYITYDRDCIRCIYNVRNNPRDPVPNICQRCLDSASPQYIGSIQDCNVCTKDRAFDDVVIGETCQRCWVSQGLAHGRCIPLQESGLIFYGSDVTNGVVDEKGWTVTGAEGAKVERINCSSHYQNLWGVSNTQNQNPVTLTWTQTNLPPHTGLYIIVNIFKTDILPYVSETDILNITVNPRQGLPANITLMNKGNPSALIPGSNLCKTELNQMINTYLYDAPKHNSSIFSISITAKNGGIFVRQLELYLGNCNQCFTNSLNYEVKYMPRYSYNNSVAPGIDVWIDFNQPIVKSSGTDLKTAFIFEIDKLPNLKLESMQFRDQIALNNRLRYFIPLDQSFYNATLKIRSNPDARIFGKSPRSRVASPARLLITTPLNIFQTENLIHRYSRLTPDDLVSTTQIYWFFNFFQWFSLITMIVCVMLGVGVVFEEFSIMLQLLFLHVYISSTLLPATYKAPMIGLWRKEHLNYFADWHARSIQWQWFGNYQHPSPYVFQQYNKDILFQRSFYPTIIINLIYLCWFILIRLAYKFVPTISTSQNPLATLLRNIAARPLNFWDQIWRYQFITAIWAAFMQFHVLKNDTAWERFNLALCFIVFIIVVVWPFVVVCYTYRLNAFKYATDFMYKYEDIFFLKMESINENKVKYYYYVFVRFLRYFIMTLFICVFTQHQIIAPVILICTNVIEIAYVFAMRIFYNSQLGTTFKILENLLFIGIQVALLFVYGLSETAREQDFLNLGYALIVMYVIMIMLGVLRVGYYLYRKLRSWRYRTKAGVENGEVVNVGPTPLPGTDRGQFVNPTNQFIQ